MSSDRTNINELISKRWSPRSFSSKSIKKDEVNQLMEAVRWAASCFNAQPWRFILGLGNQDPTWQKISSTLVEENSWANRASLLILTCIRTNFEHNEKLNRHAGHDLGLAVGNLSMQATSMGLVLHQMAGFNTQAARELFSIPNEFEPMTVIAVGYQGNPDQLQEPLRSRETAQRTRKPLAEIAYTDSWGIPFSIE